jgi:hypothetical protein
VFFVVSRKGIHMKNILYPLLFICIISFTIYPQNTASISEMSNHQIDSLLTVTAEKNLTITERIEFYSELFLGMPYNLICAGDGPYALYETEPLVNFEETNCMVYCEHVLALAISDSWDNFFNNLQQIRYKDGIIGMRTRNHYTMADWLPENDWLLDDVTRRIGGDRTKQFTRTISHQTFFSNKGIGDLRYVVPDRDVTIDYIPMQTLPEVKENIRSGDIFALIFADRPNIFSAHMLIAIRKNGKLHFRESAMSRMSTFDSTFEEWYERYKNSRTYAGLSFMRVKDELNEPGKLILPWEVAGMR